MAVGYEPLFVDVERDTQLVSIDRLANFVEAGMVSAVVVTHLFGRMVDVEAFALVMAYQSSKIAPRLMARAFGDGLQEASGNWAASASIRPRTWVRWGTAAQS